MSDHLFIQLLDIAVTLALVSAYVAVWERDLVTMVRAVAFQGLAIVGVSLLLGNHNADYELIIVAILQLALKVVILPRVLLKVVRQSHDIREVEPLVNVPASLVAAWILTIVAYAATRDIAAAGTTDQSIAMPIGFAIALIGVFLMVTRRKAVTQIIGFLLLDNGIALVALLATAGVPIVVELGASIDLLLAVLVLQVLVARLGAVHGEVDLNRLRELHD